MSMLTTAFFDGPLAVGQITQTEGAASMELAILTYEAECLREILGAVVAPLFVNGVAAEIQRWTDLKEGGAYSVLGVDYKFPGLANASAPASSILAHYVWCMYQDDNASRAAGIGRVASKAENAKRVNQIYATTRMWNRMVGLQVDLYNFLRHADTDGLPTYPEFLASDARPFQRKNTFNL